MPFVRIFLKDRTPEERRAIADAVHEALVEALGVPEGDRFQVVTAHGDDLVYDRAYLGMERTDNVVFVQVFLAQGRTVEQKKRLFATLAEKLSAANGLRPDDLMVNLVELSRENWSFGRGVAQYAEAAPPHLAAAQGAS